VNFGARGEKKNGMSPFRIVDVPGIATTSAVAGEREAKILAMIACCGLLRGAR
jgi:hypothetical protein